jgi:hypothetical protein
MDTNSKKKTLIDKIKKKKDTVRIASKESFPASDAPAHWASGPKPKPSDEKPSDEKPSGEKSTSSDS